MTPIEDIINDIRDYLGDLAEIHLLPETDIEAMRHAQEESGPLNLRKSTDAVSLHDDNTKGQCKPHIGNDNVDSRPNDKKGNATVKTQDSIEYPRGFKLGLTIFAVVLSVFMVFLSPSGSSHVLIIDI